MTRTTRSALEFDVQTLNLALERPMQRFSSAPGEPTRFSVGHLYLDHDAFGYKLEEQTSERGVTRALTPRLGAKEMALMIRGMMRGIGLRNAHIGEILLRNKLVEDGLTTADSPLYNQLNN